MQPEDSAEQFEQFVAAAGLSVATLVPSEAARLMLAFYRQVRADSCLLDQQGDMVLFQYGAYDFGQGRTFQFDLTRQFVTDAEDVDDQEMSQLSLTVHFAVADQLRALSGERWCESLAEADEFEQFITSQEVTAAVASIQPLRTTLEWGYV